MGLARFVFFVRRVNTPAPPDEDQDVHLQIALREPHTNYLQIAHEVSDPESPRYGQYLSAEELQAVLPGVDDPAAAVISWLHGNDARSIARDGEWLSFTTTVGHARSLLNADFAMYSFKDKAPVLRATSYSIPADLVSDIDFIFPVTQFLGSGEKEKSSTALHSRQHIPTGPPTCDNSTCPAQLKKLYNINYSPPDNCSGSKIGIAGFLEQYASQTDLTSFLKQYGLTAAQKSGKKPYKFAVELVNNGTNPTSPSSAGVEAMLDLDYSMVFTDPLPITYFSTGGRPPTLDPHGNTPVPTKDSQNEPYIAFLQHLLAMKNPPQVISMSYSDSEQVVPRAFADRACTLFGRLAMRGVSVIGSSGDGGAAGTDKSDCIGPDGKKRFLPTFPSSCPWVTSVGATAGFGGAASFSSGGFSNYYPVPAWQKSAAAGYIKALNGTHKGYYNASGRGIPDVSLLGDDYLIVSGGFASAHDGTSASTPLFAAMVALLNDLRLRQKKPVLGFLNPLLYASTTRGVFTDIKDGSQSVGCADSTSFEPGWEALAGWDAVTGLGTPDFAKLRKLLA
ncbi:hypothetical protein FH972_022811 [Carpinus fangiana]|uniref:tripeptidyl-peptidase II n=1 Tax=Carpinus fangiana TaxID=176857 RepID=A0A5N6KTV6_9ROSI|nr:hypothetical protein FH972_022811 [Carpinus fangiana]